MIKGTHTFMIIASILLFAGCSEKQDSSKVDSLAFIQDNKKDKSLQEKYGNAYLVNFAHSNTIKIAVDMEEECFNEAEIKQSVSRAIGIWFEGLNTAHNQGLVQLIQPIHNLSLNFEFKDSFFFDEDLRFNFICGSGRAGYDQDFGFLYSTKPKIRMYSDDNDFGILVHEVGHAFGLADTYLETEANKNLGEQPDSVMAIKTRGVSILAQDDLVGLAWLYRYYVLQDIATNECLKNYVYEQATGGCIPSISHNEYRP